MGRLSKIHQQICLVHEVHLAVVEVLYSKNLTSIEIPRNSLTNESNTTDTTPLIDDIISESSEVEECSEDDDGDGEIDDDIIIPPYALSINATITNVRNIVRKFRNLL
ncbi:hypothetical protein LOD99_8628 [Oopsacas minuta]|uniref:Uncharacterized protein n=1 Tax=Oopsacas minuta TaxID=111878 RepID=A0AAV7JG82_9METZ|nr:hypothetical protein LOD99_8628 [Oopsacas minuta]